MQQEYKIRNPLASFIKYSCLVLCIVIVHMVLMFSANCADQDNCLRGWCKGFSMRKPYMDWIELNCKRNQTLY